MDISFCLITRDNAATLQACLESVVALCDEFIVVDTGSRDETPQIARRFGAKLIHAPWQNDFSAARNRYLTAARGSWILSLDGDEVAGGWDPQWLRNFLRRGRNTAFYFQIRNYFPLENCDLCFQAEEFAGEVSPGVGCRLSSTVRLFPNRHGIRYAYPVHESLAPSLNKTGIPIRRCPLPIHHFGNMGARERTAEKTRMYKALGLRKIAEYPRYFRGYWELGKVLLRERDLEHARNLFAACVRLNPAFASGWYFLVLSSLLLERPDEAKRSLEEALRHVACSMQLALLRGMVDLRTGKAEAACRCFHFLLKRKPHYLQARVELARAYEQAGHRQLAAKQLLAVVRQAPWHTQASWMLVKLAEDLEDRWLLTEALSLGMKSFPVSSPVRMHLDLEATLEPRTGTHAAAGAAL